ncbi:MAG: nucleotidyltransferase family protein [Halioglobus sp.]|nr:nucleotidyltransferase family protein [Halioglobus sp.]
MKAMILAAGVGERMRPLTEHTPKPLLRVADTPLIEHHIRRLASAGFSEIVINVAHLGEQIMDYCADGRQWGVTIVYSPERSPLETAGGIVNALPLLGNKPFLVVNSDIWIDYPFAKLAVYRLRPDEVAHLVMVENPPQHVFGDFQLDDEGWVRPLEAGTYGWTYAGLGVYSATFFAAISQGKKPLRPLLDAAISKGQLGGERYLGQWQDVGTPERLQELNNVMKGFI